LSFKRRDYCEDGDNRLSSATSCFPLAADGKQRQLQTKVNSGNEKILFLAEVSSFFIMSSQFSLSSLITK
jgi:hypothetical protein